METTTIILHLCTFVTVLSSLLIIADGRLLANEPVLLFPQSTLFQFTVGVSVPIAMDKKGGIVFTSGFQFNYALPWNLSQFEPMIVKGRNYDDQRERLCLKNVYSTIEEILEKYGWGDGRSCLLRTICELADSPIDRTSGDVIEEIVHLLLTPSEDVSDDESQESELHRYHEAEALGRNNGRFNCAKKYRDCVLSPIDSFTELAAMG